MSYSFANRDGSFLSEAGTYPVRYVVPVTAATVTLTPSDVFTYINPAGTIAALTVKLPPNPTPGMRVELSFGAIVTALTIQTSAAGSVTGSATAGAVGVNQAYVYISDLSLWKRWE